MKLRLAIIHMDMVVETLELEPGSYTFGRSRDNNIVVQHFSLHRVHGDIFCEENQWYYKNHETGRTVLITNVEPIHLSADVSIATGEYVEHERTHIEDFSSVFKRHKSKLKFRVSLVSAFVAALLLFSVIGYQLVKKSTPVNANNLLNQVRGKIVEFEVNRNEQAIKDLKDYSGLKDSAFKETSGFCTGFLVAPNVVLTASHCLFGTMIVDLNNDFYLRSSDGKKHQVKNILGFDIKRDYLYLETEGMEDYGYLEFAPDYKIEQKVYTVGNVHGEGIAIRDGIISSETTDLNDPDVKFIRYSAGTSPGNSGGPLVDVNGRVVALVFAATWTENFNLGTSAEDLKNGFVKFVGENVAPKKATIAMKKLLNFNSQAILQSLSLPYLAQFDEYPEIVEKFNEISFDISVPVALEKVDQVVLSKINKSLIDTYNEVQKMLKERNEIILDWKSFVSEKTPSIMPSQFDFSQNTFIKKNGRYYPKLSGFIDSPSKADMSKYTRQLDKERKFDFQAYGYNIFLEDEGIGLKQGDVLYKPKNSTGSKLRLQDLSQGAPYSQLVIRNNYDFNGDKNEFDIDLFLQNFVEPHGVLANSASRFIRPKSAKDFTIKKFDVKDRLNITQVKDLQGRNWTRTHFKLFSSTHIYNYCTKMPEGPLCLGRILYVYNPYLLEVIESNFRNFVLSHLLINPYFWDKNKLVEFVQQKKAEPFHSMHGMDLRISGNTIFGRTSGFPFQFEIPNQNKVESIRIQSGLVGDSASAEWTGYGLEWVQRESGKDLLCGLGLEVFKTQSNFILNFLRDRKKHEKMQKIKGEDPKPLPGIWYRPFSGLKRPFQIYGYCAPLEDDPRVNGQYFVDFKNAKPFRYKHKVTQ